MYTLKCAEARLAAVGLVLYDKRLRIGLSIQNGRRTVCLWSVGTVLCSH